MPGQFSMQINNLGFHGQSYPLFVGELNPPPFKLILENTVLWYNCLASFMPAV
jgi:hypothetical protein